MINLTTTLTQIDKNATFMGNKVRSSFPMSKWELIFNSSAFYQC